MPNWCYTQYAVKGPEKQLNSLYGIMKNIQDGKTVTLENGFGLTWLGNLVKELGKDPKVVRCRGEWSDLDKPTNSLLLFNTETAWYRPEDIENLLKEKFPDIEILFMTEELGCNIFETNDLSGKFFTDIVIIDEEQEGLNYYTVQGALERISELKGSPVTTINEAKSFCTLINKAQDTSGGDGHIWIHEIEYV